MILHREHGVNPRLGICTQCGKDVGVVLIGTHEYKARCRNCNAMVYGAGKCPRCGRYTDDSTKELIEEHEKIPMGLCDECEANNKACEDEVKKGGVFWKCEACGSQGAIKAEHPLSKAAREQMGVEPPDPCGVLFTSAECPVCQKNEER